MASYSNGEDTRNIITRAAVRLFWEKGYSATTFEDICRLAHVKRSTINYHFKTKEQILQQCKKYTFEKTVMAASCCCHEPAYVYILAESIYWYYILHDASFFKMATEYARLEMLNDEPDNSHYNRLITCFLPSVQAAGMEPPAPLPLTEVALKGLEYAPFLLGAKIKEENHVQVMENFLQMVGRICGLPDSIIQTTWLEVQSRMNRISYESLHLHWP